MPTEDDLRRASTDALLERHVGEPLREITGEVMQEVAGRIAAVLADLEDLEPAPAIIHWADCWRWHAGCLAARIRATLTGDAERVGDGQL